MDIQSRRSGSVTFVLVGLVLLSTAGIALLLPILGCPIDRFLDYTDRQCHICGGRTRITLLQQLRNPRFAVAEWEGMTLGEIEDDGFEKTNVRHALDLAGVSVGLPLTNQMRVNAAKILLATGCYSKVSVLAKAEWVNSGTVHLWIDVVEAPGRLQLPEGKK